MIQVTKCDDAQTVAIVPPEPRGQSSNVVQLVPLRFPNEAALLRRVAAHREECADCIHMALICLLGLAVMLFISSLLRHGGIEGDVAHYLQAGLGFLAAASGFAAALAACLALVHFIQLRQI